MQNCKTDIINANLDAGLVVGISIARNGGGHAVVGDGYGYNNGTLYHHINLGWGGLYDAWYQLPIVDTGYLDYDTISGITYNIYTTGTGEIISGRILDDSGTPVSGITVSLSGGGIKRTTESNVRGIYAFAKVPSAATYVIDASRAGMEFTSKSVTTGTSYNYDDTGNRWGVNLIAKIPTRLPAPAPDPLVFGNVKTNSSKTLSFRISNSGNSVLTVGGLSCPAGFSGDWSGIIAAGGRSPLITVDFLPTALQGYGGDIKISCDNTGGDVLVAVSGTGSVTQTTVPAPNPDPLSFGEVQKHSREIQSFRISNSGNAILTVNGLNCPVGFKGNWKGTIAAGSQSPPISIIFSPAEVKWYSGEILIDCDNSGGDTTLTVSGEGTPGVDIIGALMSLLLSQAD